MTQDFQHLLNPPQLGIWHLPDDGVIPNNKLPLLMYQNAVRLAGGAVPGVFEKLFFANGWEGAWSNGIYTYHHYHSTAHEVLGILKGSATVQLGGERGIKQKVSAGDVLVIPAGVAHKNLGASSDFSVVGAYPRGQEWDMNYGRPQERPAADEHIARVPMPPADPVYGKLGPLQEHWTKACDRTGN